MFASRIPALTEALSELTWPSIGILTRKSAASMRILEMPNPSLPTMRSVG